MSLDRDMDFLYECYEEALQKLQQGQNGSQKKVMEAAVQIRFALNRILTMHFYVENWSEKKNDGTRLTEEEKINFLHDYQVIDNALAAKYHKLRIVGNKGAHADKSISIDEVSDAVWMLGEEIKRLCESGIGSKVIDNDSKNKPKAKTTFREKLSTMGWFIIPGIYNLVLFTVAGFMKGNAQELYGPYDAELELLFLFEGIFTTIFLMAIHLGTQYLQVFWIINVAIMWKFPLYIEGIFFKYIQFCTGMASDGNSFGLFCEKFVMLPLFLVICWEFPYLITKLLSKPFCQLLKYLLD